MKRSGYLNILKSHSPLDNFEFNSNIPILYQDIEQLWNDPIFYEALSELIDLINGVVRIIVTQVENQE